MRKLLLLLLFIYSQIQAQVVPTPDLLWGPLFKDVQMTRAMGDNKTFVDMLPQKSPAEILRDYVLLKTKDSASLRQFVLQHFYLPATPAVQVTEGLPLHEHLNELWDLLYRKADTLNKWSSLLPLPNPYIVPGGRFREIYYWDSYFTMQGLEASNRIDLIENMVKNFAFLIQKYGHIPNGNRNYYLGRSQPPYFALMVDLLQRHQSNAYQTYLPAMEKEYRFWMDGKQHLSKTTAYRRLVRLPDGSVLNRYWDDVNKPRQESYREDVMTVKVYRPNDGMVYRNLRGAAESGWDFTARWFRDTVHLNTIETTNMVPVDLNSLLYAYETVLSKAALAAGNTAKASEYAAAAKKRRAAIEKYCWNASLRYYFDYDFKQNHTTNKWTLAGVMPLFCNVAASDRAADVRTAMQEKFLKDGGVVSTLYHTGQQWDAPNGWPPLQFLTVQGLVNYGFTDLARTIAERWLDINERVFKNTGKMMEKYNVENIHLESGGGEYPTQDGFGWTNGVYLKFHQMFRAGKE